jgi:phosphoribosylaminoimidazolecarboxamide formyltransferase/IMP cyclohydrolase
MPAAVPGAYTETDVIPVRRALMSVSDKTGIVELARGLIAAGAEIISTGGTAAALKAEGLAVTDIDAVTGFPEIMHGRVKTLHPKIHGGLLAIRDEPSHAEAMEEHAIAGIDLIAVNLYPFEQVVSSSTDPVEIIENIDIGGPAMTRAAAKNAAYVACVTDPADYGAILAEVAEKGGTGRATRARLAAKAFARTAAYDAAISSWYAGHLGDALPERLTVAASRAQILRYGENPHQQAALYRTAETRPGVATARQVLGKELSFNNINDADAAFELVSEFDPASGPAVAIIKHANPCGVATGPSLAEAYALALRCDPVSAFGGIVALNQPLDGAAAEEIVRIFTEVVIAPDADEAAIAAFAAKPNLRLLLTGGLASGDGSALQVRTIAGGLLVQDHDRATTGEADLKLVTKRAPDARELADMLFAFTVAKHVKSNAIVYVKDGATAGIGAGQMSRVDSARIAAIKAGEAAEAAGLPDSLAKGSVVASDAFFPFPDGLLTAAEAGATAVIQPGGSMRDDEVIAAADEAGLAMVFTGKRHFRH